MKLFPSRQLYSEGKTRPLLRGVFHGVGIFITLFMLYELLTINACVKNNKYIFIYFICHFLQFFVSFIYHRFPHNISTEIFLQKLDHSLIPLCIYGSWIPLIHYTLDKQRAIVIDSIMFYGVVLMAILVFVFRISKPYLHVAYSHLILIEMTTMNSRLTDYEKIFMWVGTGLHIISSIQFGLKKPFEHNTIFGFHEIFHILNVTAVIIFYCFVRLLVSRDCINDHFIPTM